MTEAESQHIAQICHMEEWPVQVTPNGEKAKLHSISSKTGYLTPLKSDAWCENKYPGYFVDYFGRPTFFYDPRRCSEAGYFAKILLPQFALLKIYAKHPPAEFDTRAMESLVQMTVCYMGFGFTLLAMSQRYSGGEGAAPLNISTSKSSEKAGFKIRCRPGRP